ncbi:MAG TPA: MFS transporter [Planctomycetota bacterium]|nr:MFS transporter [Planctomycetota bacterium]
MSVTTEIPSAAGKLARFHRRYFAQRIIYAWELPSIMRKHIYTGVMGSIYFNLIAGLFFLDFGNRIGVSLFEWGLMGGISSFLLSAQLLSAYVTRQAGRRKAVWFWFAVAGRATRFTGILVAFVLFQTGWSHASVVLVAATCTANFLMAMTIPPWYSWLADIIPEEHHGGFWGRRTWWIHLAIICVIIPAALVVDRTSDEARLWVLMGFFLVALVVGLLDLVIHGTIPEPGMKLAESRHFLHDLLEPVLDAAFRPWLVFNMCWTFSMTLGGSLANIHFLTDLGIERNMMWGAAVLVVLPLAGGLFTARRSGALVDRVGPKRVLFWGHLFWSVLPLFWVWATPETALVWLSISSVVGGSSSAIAMVAANKLITRFPPPGHKVAMYVAVSSCLGSLAGGVGAVAAGTVMKLVPDASWQALGTTVGAFQLLFIVSFLLRFVTAVTLLPRLRNPNRTGAST